MKTTIIKWFRPEEKMPDKGTQSVLVITDTNNIHKVYYSDKYKAFNANSYDGAKYAFDNVKYWDYLPKFEEEL